MAATADSCRSCKNDNGTDCHLPPRQLLQGEDTREVLIVPIGDECWGLTSVVRITRTQRVQCGEMTMKSTDGPRRCDEDSYALVTSGVLSNPLHRHPTEGHPPPGRVGAPRRGGQSPTRFEGVLCLGGGVWRCPLLPCEEALIVSLPEPEARPYQGEGVGSGRESRFC